MESLIRQAVSSFVGIPGRLAAATASAAGSTKVLVLMLMLVLVVELCEVRLEVLECVLVDLLVALTPGARYGVDTVVVHGGSVTRETMVDGPSGPADVVVTNPESDADGVIDAVSEATDASEDAEVVSADAEVGDVEKVEEVEDAVMSL